MPSRAVGIRAGSFILYPSLTTSFEHDTNGSGNGRSDTMTVTPELDAAIRLGASTRRR